MIEYDIKKERLNLYERNQFILNVVKDCVDFKDKTIDRTTRNISIKENFARSYLKVPFKNENEDNSAFDNYDMICDLDINAYLKKGVSEIQYNDIVEDINLTIDEYEKRFNKENESSTDRLLGSIIRYLDTMSDSFESADLNNLAEMLNDKAKEIVNENSEDMAQDNLPTKEKIS